MVPDRIDFCCWNGPVTLNEFLPTRNDWSIADGVTYLNHGSFGPAPRVVQDAREEWSRRLQSQPMSFYLEEMDRALDAAMKETAKFLGGDPNQMAFVDNATFAMNIVASSVPLEQGDEVLLNDHEYGAVFRIWRQRCDQVAAKLVTARLGDAAEQSSEPQSARTAPLFSSTEEIIDSIFEAVTPRTKLIVVSHVTSPSAIILPVAEICRRARAIGVPVCVDGPHAIAMLPLNLREIDCDFYCGSFHKWLSAPFGSGFLFIHRRQMKNFRPPLVSWGRNLGGFPDRWQDQVNWLGTRDPASFLAVPTAIQYLQQVGLDRFREVTHSLAQYARHRLESLFQQSAWVPDSSEWYGSMVSIPLPPSDYKKAKPNSMHRLQKQLRERDRIEVPIPECRGQYVMRVSCHLYNTPDDIDQLVDAVERSRELI